MVSVQSILTEN